MTAKRCHGLKLGVFMALIDAPTGDPARIAKRAEDLGFDSYWAPEHAVIPQGSCDVYPGKADADPPPDYLFKMPDPLIALARASAVTKTWKTKVSRSSSCRIDPWLTMCGSMYSFLHNLPGQSFLSW